jgi:putative addiction module killer protein
MEIRQTRRFASWLESLSDLRGRARILARIERLAAGHPGDVKPVGQGVSEMRVDVGPGYRVYYVEHQRRFIVLLAGGDKRSQKRDIELAQRLARDL